MATVATPMTTEEFLALPDDGVERWLIDGELREFPSQGKEYGMTVRNRFHSRTLIRTGKFLDNWLDLLPLPRGQVLGGEAGVRLSRDPETIVGIDIVYVGAEVIIRQTDETTLIDGVPILAVEILSPNDKQEDIHDKLDTYRRAKVPVVWIIDPRDQTVRVYRAGAEPELFNVRQELTGEPHLPGFRVAVARLFE